MKSIIVAFLASCVVSLAQTNTNNSAIGINATVASSKPEFGSRYGYVTNGTILTFTNLQGRGFTNVIFVNAEPRTILFRTDNLYSREKFTNLPQEVRDQFNWTPEKAALAEEANKQKKAREQQFYQQQRENAATQDLIWKQVQAHRESFTVTGDGLRVDQITKEGILVSDNHTDSEPDFSYSLAYFVKDFPNQNALIDGATIRGTFYEIGTYTYTTVMGASKTLKCLTYSPKSAFNFYLIQAGVVANKNKEMAQQQIDEQQKEAAVPKAKRDVIWQRVQAYETKFNAGFLTVRQITKDGIMASYDPESTDKPGQYYFVKDCPYKDSLYESSDLKTIRPPFYEIGTYTYTTVMGASKTLQCLTCSKHAAFEYYLTH
jgi:hypothetical protein